MAQWRRLPVDVGAGFPQRFQTRVAGVLLRFEVRYNGVADLYTVDIYDQRGEPIVYGRPVIYGANLLDGIVDDRLPPVRIVPADMAGKRQYVGRDVFGVEVHLWISEPVA